jgi:hypothetical protein
VGVFLKHEKNAKHPPQVGFLFGLFYYDETMFLLFEGFIRKYEKLSNFNLIY